MRTLPLIAALALPLVACQQPAELLVTKSWVRLPAVAGGPAAAYFTIKGGATADKLLRVSSEITTRTELHESMNHDGHMMMRPIDGIDVPAEGTVELKPGGKHIMLYGLPSATKPGSVVRLTLTFQGGQELLVDAPARAANAPAE